MKTLFSHWLLNIVIIILGIIASIVGAILANKKNKKLEQDILEKGAFGKSIYEGIEYSFDHYTGLANDPPHFEVTVKCNFSGDFLVTGERPFDFFSKKSTKVETDDKEFDDNFFITTDEIDFARAYFNQPDKREAIKAIFARGFNMVKHNGKKKEMTAFWKKYPRDHDMDTNTLGDIVHFLAQLCSEIPVYQKDTFTTISWKKKRFIAFAVPIFLMIVGGVSLKIGLNIYRPLDDLKIAADSFKYSLPCLFLYLWAALFLLKGRSTSLKEIGYVVIFSIIGFSLAGMGAQITLNGWLDKSNPAVHEAEVIDKRSHSDSKTNFATVKSWRENRNYEDIKISRSFYDEIEPGQSKMIITTKRGKFGFEWVESYK